MVFLCAISVSVILYTQISVLMLVCVSSKRAVNCELYDRVSIASAFVSELLLLSFTLFFFFFRNKLLVVFYSHRRMYARSFALSYTYTFIYSSCRNLPVKSCAWSHCMCAWMYLWSWNGNVCAYNSPDTFFFLFFSSLFTWLLLLLVFHPTSENDHREVLTISPTKFSSKIK